MSTSLAPRTLALLGAGFGAALLLRPREVLSAVGADPNLPYVVPATRVLGARHLTQAIALAIAPTRMARLSSLIDGSHAASMFGLAALSPDYRRAALVSAGVATALGVGTSTL